MTAELERSGLPSAMISALAPVALDLGANRVVEGVRIPHPCGDPALDAAGDLTLREAIVRTALAAVGTRIDKARIFSASRDR